MTLKETLDEARELLTSEDKDLEAEVLLRHTLNIDRTALYLSLHNMLTPQQKGRFRKMVERRLSGELVAYITQNREFYGLDFYVDNRVLIPRPDTETLVEKAFDYAVKHPGCTIADIGTGCGAIAIALAVELPRSVIYATDISAQALEVAEYNCRKHGVSQRIRLLQGDLLDPLPEEVDLIAANLPYVKKEEVAQVTRGYEPETALEGGADGLRDIFRLCRQLNGRLRLGGRLMLEIGLGQAEAVTSFLNNLSPGGIIEVTKDLGGIERVVSLGSDVHH
jgi:release factor glutamine methyltransferase